MEKTLGHKIYYTISEVSQLADLKPYTLRAWEKDFSCLRPRRMGGKNRAYRNKDIGIVLLIKRLIYSERFTIQGVVKKLKENPELILQAESEFTHLIQSQEGVKAPEMLEQKIDPLIGLVNEGLKRGIESQPNHKAADWLESTKQEIRYILNLLAKK